MLDSLLIGIVTAGVTRSEALDCIPFFFLEGGEAWQMPQKLSDGI